jgi:hypothetical protein
MIAVQKTAVKIFALISSFSRCTPYIPVLLGPR